MDLTPTPAVFFDRDGVLIETEVRNGKPYAIRDVKDLVIFPDALAVINQFKNAGYKIVVVTNQPDVGNGLVEQSVVEAMHTRLLAELPIDLIKACYHQQGSGCNCRKPNTGMFTEAAAKLNIDLANSIMIGDRSSDIEAGQAAGCFTIFIDYGYNESLKVRADLIVSSLTDVLKINFKGVKSYGCSEC
jgi:D-glycero-D-manno-heptose 1,7-bisphosphate phosphatase